MITTYDDLIEDQIASIEAMLRGDTLPEEGYDWQRVPEEHWDHTLEDHTELSKAEWERINEYGPEEDQYSEAELMAIDNGVEI